MYLGYFLLPNQPMNDFVPFCEYLDKLDIDTSGLIGFLDWKLLSLDIRKDSFYSAIPSFIVDAFKNKFGREKLINASHIYLSPSYGARSTNNANEIARYEYGASLASDALLTAYDHLSEGVSAEITLEDDKLIEDIKTKYPKLWHRIENRREYIKNELNINLDKSILPLASTLAYLRPLMLNKDVALVRKDKAD